jgi:hypothetical protein
VVISNVEMMGGALGQEDGEGRGGDVNRWKWEVGREMKVDEEQYICRGLVLRVGNHLGMFVALCFTLVGIYRIGFAFALTAVPPHLLMHAFPHSHARCLRPLGPSLLSQSQLEKLLSCTLLSTSWVLTAE